MILNICSKHLVTMAIVTVKIKWKIKAAKFYILVLALYGYVTDEWWRQWHVMFINNKC